MAVDCHRASRPAPRSCGTGPDDRSAPGGNPACRRPLRDLKSPRFALVQLAPAHDLERFTCGQHPGAADIDEYLTTSALAEQRAGLSQVWIALDLHDAAVAGYFTLSPLSVPVSPDVLAQLGLGTVPYRAVGGYLLGRLGVAVHRQGEGLDGILIAAAIRTARQAQKEVGGAFLAVDPKILKKHGYPPDLQDEAVKTVLAQAEVLCAEWEHAAVAGGETRCNFQPLREDFGWREQFNIHILSGFCQWFCKKHQRSIG